MSERDDNPSQDTESILEQAFVEPILEQARQNLSEDGMLVPCLFLSFPHVGGGVMPLELPETHAEREVYFTMLGLTLLSMGQTPDKVLFLSETWYVEMDARRRRRTDVAPSQHPQRREAITLVGRDAARSHFTMVVQPFGRDAQEQPVFEALAVAEYNVPRTPSAGPVGLLDQLFPKRSTPINK